MHPQSGSNSEYQSSTHSLCGSAATLREGPPFSDMPVWKLLQVLTDRIYNHQDDSQEYPSSKLAFVKRGSWVPPPAVN